MRYKKEIEMKKVIFIFTVFFLLFALDGCGGTSGSTSTTGSTADNSTALPEEMQLLIGTFKLEDTDLAVNSEQAAQLLPLWQALQSLETSDTAAAEEIAAVVNQIKATMTAQQMDAITAMKLTQQDVMTVMNNSGLPFNNAGASSTPNASSGSSQSGFPAGGGDPGAAGGPPSGGGVVGAAGGPPSGVTVIEVAPGGDAGFNPQQMATAQAGGQSGNSNNQIPTPLLKALIDLLQKKVQS
jgi:uncharacterized membrane protein YgcG